MVVVVVAYTDHGEVGSVEAGEYCAAVVPVLEERRGPLVMVALARTHHPEVGGELLVEGCAATCPPVVVPVLEYDDDGDDDGTERQPQAWAEEQVELEHLVVHVKEDPLVEPVELGPVEEVEFEAEVGAGPEPGPDPYVSRYPVPVLSQQRPQQD